MSDINDIYEVYISLNALKKSLEHVNLNKDVEVLGFLIGDFYLWNKKGYTLIEDSWPIESISKHNMVEPNIGSLAKALNKLNKKLKRNIIVGWYHSHPGYGCFLSPIDIQTQKSFFTKPYHVALVIDPIRMNLNFFKLTNNSYRRASFIIFEKVKKK